MTRRRATILIPAVAVAALAAAVAAPAVQPVAATPSASTSWRPPCPAAQNLVTPAKWSSRHLAPGVIVKTGTANDTTVEGQPGQVQMHVLTVKLAQPGIRFAPLLSHVAQRTRLSQLTANHQHLMAATNTGFFDFNTGAPLGPLFTAHTNYVLTRSPRNVIGFTKSNRPVIATAWLDGSVVAGGETVTLQGLNPDNPPSGLSLYTPTWGNSRDIPLGDSHRITIRRVLNGKIDGGVLSHDQVPNGAELLLATSPDTVNWLSSLHNGDAVAVHRALRTSSEESLTQGYAVGKEVVAPGGKAAPRLGCNERDTQAARTAVGISKDGKYLMVLVVTDRPCFGRGCPSREIHGLDLKELSRVLRDLGAGWAWQWDGSGSSEMIGRLNSTHQLTVLNYCSDGVERPMPVGFGVFYQPAKKKKG